MRLRVADVCRRELARRAGALMVALGCVSLGCRAQPASETGHAPMLTARDGYAWRIVADDGHPIAVWSKLPPEPIADVVLVHGRTWSGRPDFDLQVPGEDRSLMDALVRHRLAAHAVDLRGYGKTPRDASGWLTPTRAAADVHSVLEAVTEQHGRTPVVLGWSMGALVSQLVAQEQPDAMSGLVLYGYPRDPKRPVRPRDSVPDPVVPPARKTTAAAAQSDFTVPGATSAATRDAFVRAALGADPVRADWRAQDEFGVLKPSAVRVPTLIIAGAQDPYAPPARMIELFRELGTDERQLVLLDEGDHAAHLERAGPRFVAAVVAVVSHWGARGTL